MERKKLPARLYCNFGKCPCGLLVKPGKRFIHGHNARVTNHPSLFGSANPFFGKHHTEEIKEVLREKNKNKVFSQETRDKISLKTRGAGNGMFGNRQTKEAIETIKQKCSAIAKDHWADPVAAEAHRAANAKLNRSEEARKKNSVGQQRRWSDPENRKKHKEVTQRAASNPERIKKQSVSMTKRWAVPGYREKVSNKIKAAKNTHESKLKRSKQVFPVQDTKTVEVPLQKFFTRWGIPFEKHQAVKELHPYHPFDIVIPYIKLAIDGQGCYWHGCQSCMPGSVSKTKFDQELPIVRRRAQEHGWIVVEVWEHDIKSGAAWDMLLDLVRARELERVNRK